MYQIEVIELVRHSRLPNWLLRVKYIISELFSNGEVMDRDSALYLLDREIDGLVFIIRNTKQSGKIIQRRIIGNEMYFYTNYKNTPLLKIGFKSI